ncbi:MAG: hypothetical protein KatS3mg013_0889 [Actinomycetota bacterium]|jgi:ribosomal subunit interface protein|nr:MAG: hypothetical protein KatS3mg013_0889 [Actinomycetota bacterium]
MRFSYTARGVLVSDELRRTTERKLARLSRLEPRTTSIDVEFIAEHHPRPDGTTRVEAALRIPRKTFRASAEAEDVTAALDRVAEKLERQVRDHHRRVRGPSVSKGLESAVTPAPEPGTPHGGST